MRVGYIAADAALVDALVERKVLSVLSGSTLLESVVSEVLDGGRYKRHVEQTRARLARMRRDARAALELAGIRFEAAGGEGIFLWGRVPDAAPVEELVSRAWRALDPAGEAARCSPRRRAAGSGCASTSRTATARRCCSSCAARCTPPERGGAAAFPAAPRTGPVR